MTSPDKPNGVIQVLGRFLVSMGPSLLASLRQFSEAHQARCITDHHQAFPCHWDCSLWRQARQCANHHGRPPVPDYPMTTPLKQVVPLQSVEICCAFPCISLPSMSNDQWKGLVKSNHSVADVKMVISFLPTSLSLSSLSSCAKNLITRTVIKFLAQLSWSF